MRAVQLLTGLLDSIVDELGFSKPSKAVIEPPKDKKFGDLAANYALVLAKDTGKNPRELAGLLAEKLRTASPEIASVEIAGPGFLNVTFAPAFRQAVIPLIENTGDRYGSSNLGAGKKLQVEFVSANPTGPLHIGHGRGAAIGDSLCRVMRFAGYNAEAEYYINDAGKQMRTLGLSIWLRALELTGKRSEPFPEDCYKGEYIIDIARELLAKDPDLTERPEAEGQDVCYEYGLKDIFDGIKKDLLDFGVHHDVWFSERSLVESGVVEQTLEELKRSGRAFEQDGALWFRTTEHGDDKDRVLRKSDGTLTYFASDIAYHADKYRRGFERVIDVWGADHHGYIPRMRAAVAALGKEQEAFDVVLVQLVNLLQGGEQIAMSTRAGKFETLADVLAEVGSDAARFIFLSRKSDSKLDFDLELVKQRTMDNPVYYVQYAHARIAAVGRRVNEQNGPTPAEADLSLLVAEEELDLLRLLDRFPQAAWDAAHMASPHFISHYLMELAGLLHRAYAVLPVMGAENRALGAARLRLLNAVAQTLRNGLALLGVSAPKSM